MKVYSRLLLVDSRVDYGKIFLYYIFGAWVIFSIVCSADDSLRDIILSADRVAVSVDLYPGEFVIAVSPVRQTLQIIHSTARIAGALVSEVQNDNFKKKLKQVVGELNVPEEFKQEYLNSLREILGDKVEEVLPMGSSAKYSNEYEARIVRIQTLKKKGYDVLIDIKLTSGIYGPEGEMFFRIGGTIIDLRNEKTLWRGEIIISSECREMKITSPFKTYFNPFKSNYFSPRLTIADDALSQWTDNDGKGYFEFKRYGIDLVNDAFLTDIGLKETAKGWFGVGLSQVYKKKWKKALEYFEKAGSLEPDNIIFKNAKIMALYKTKKGNEAIELGEKLVERGIPSEMMYVYYNLSYIYAKVKKDMERAKEYYQKYVQLGGKPERKFNPLK